MRERAQATMHAHGHDGRLSGAAETHDARIEIRSYRRVFVLERRLYRIDRIRLNPGGVPLRGIVYCAALLCAALLARGLPLFGDVVSLVPWYLRDGAFPALAAAALTAIRVDGRTAHVALVSLLVYASSRRARAWRRAGAWRRGTRRCPARRSSRLRGMSGPPARMRARLRGGPS